jgi:hypothetical protein
MSRLPFLTNSTASNEKLQDQWHSLSISDKKSSLLNCSEFMSEYFNTADMNQWIDTTAPKLLISWADEIIKSAHLICANHYRHRQLINAKRPNVINRIKTDIDKRRNTEVIHTVQRIYLKYDQHSADSIHDLIYIGKYVHELVLSSRDTDTVVVEFIYSDGMDNEGDNIDSTAIGIISRYRNALFIINTENLYESPCTSLLKWYCSPYITASLRENSQVKSIDILNPFLHIDYSNAPFVMFQNEWGLSGNNYHNQRKTVELMLKHMFTHSMLIKMGEISESVTDDWISKYWFTFWVKLHFTPLNMLLCTAFWLNGLFNTVHKPGAIRDIQTIKHEQELFHSESAPNRELSIWEYYMPIREISPPLSREKSPPPSREISPPLSREKSPPSKVLLPNSVELPVTNKLPLTGKINNINIRDSRRVVTPY